MIPMTDPTPTPLPAAPDWRALLAIYVHAHTHGNAVPPHIDTQARAALATQPAATREAGPLPQAEISDKELLELMPQQLRDDFAEAARCCAENVEHVMAAGGFRVLLNTSALAYARAVWDRAVLARWGGAAVPPSAGAEISDAEWCALKDRLWDQHETVGDQGERFMWYAHFDTALDLARKELARWGGAAAQLPQVGAEISDEELAEVASAAGRLIASARAVWPRVLAATARPAIQPVPVSERLPELKHCDLEGRCWLCGKVEGDWRLLSVVNPGVPHLKYCFSHWLPHWALLVPAADKGGEAQP
jgi:hypothetical protein